MTAAVTPLEAACAVCKYTGSVSQCIDGDLDCTNCDAVQDRMVMRKLMNLSPNADDTAQWQAHVLGLIIGSERRAAAPVVPVAAQPEDEYNSFITAYRLWQAEEAPNAHPDMVSYMSDSHWKRAAGAMWRARAALAAPQPAASVTDVAKDAARFAWLIGNVVSGSIGFDDWWINADEHAEEWRAAIDAAIAAQQGEKT